MILSGNFINRTKEAEGSGRNQKFSERGYTIYITFLFQTGEKIHWIWKWCFCRFLSTFDWYLITLREKKSSSLNCLLLSCNLSHLTYTKYIAFIWDREAYPQGSHLLTIRWAGYKATPPHSPTCTIPWTDANQDPVTGIGL